MTGELPVAVHHRLDALGGQYGLDERAVAGLTRLLAVLASDELAPTAVRKPEQAVDAHVADALVALELPAIRRARRIADLGAGAGVPGLVLAAALAAARVALVESVGRKCAFLERAVAAVAPDNASVVCRRIEEWGEGAGVHDVVSARALAPLAVLVEYAAPLLQDGGALIAWKGARDPDEELTAARAADEVGLEPHPVRQVAPFPGADHRHLHVFVKARPTPARFPRRVGVARKRSLGRG